MRMPKEIATYCTRCKSHQTHKVSIYKAGKRRALAQ
ncbi:50S ribosomal protein L44e, partial [Candidatus Bathyarchaeota archaeon]